MLKLISVIVSLAALIGPAQADIVSNAHYYANQTPYGDPATTSIKTPPTGYELVFLENVGRHGSRSQTSTDSEKRALAVWNAAARQGKLMAVGVFATGYVLGAKAGRERYEEIRRAFGTLTADPRIKEFVIKVEERAMNHYNNASHNGDGVSPHRS